MLVVCLISKQAKEEYLRYEERRIRKKKKNQESSQWNGNDMKEYYASFVCIFLSIYIYKYLYIS